LFYPQLTILAADLGGSFADSAADPVTRAPFPRAARFAETFADMALQAGLVVWPNVGQADGRNGDLALIAPPFIITDEEIDLLVQRFGEALRATVERIGAVA
jgi:adenosylmethionine-8-amino-7-oxononanoate aminotransferase